MNFVSNLSCNPYLHRNSAVKHTTESNSQLSGKILGP